MAYPETFIRQQLLFTLSPGEVASTGFSWSKEPTGPGAITDTDVEDFAGAADDLWTGLRPVYSNATAYYGTRLQLIGTSGVVLQTREQLVAGIPGTGTGKAMPTEVAVCLSLNTTNAGRSGRGRAYFPAPMITEVTDDGYMTSFFQNALADLAQEFLSHDFTNDFHPYVMSQVSPNMQRITACRVGNVYDVQRRRRDALPEAYEVRTVT